ARVHVHRRYARRAHMRDEGDAARPEARILVRAGYLLPHLLGEGAVDGRNVDADLLEDAASHDRHDAAARIRGRATRRVFCGSRLADRSLPGLAFEAPGLPPIRHRPGQFVFQSFERRADAVAKRFEPDTRRLAMLVCTDRHDALGNPVVCRRASPNTMAAASATFSERSPGAIGTHSRASAAACTVSGAPALSRPRRRMSPP